MKYVYKGFLILVTAFLALTIIVRFLGIHTYAVKSDSMSPTIPKYALVYAKQMNKSETVEFQEGDIVIFNRNERVMHRIVSIKGTEITTQGDRNESEDAPIHQSQIIARYVFFVPWIGVYFLSIIPWVVTIGFIIIGYVLVGIYREVKHGKNKELKR